MKAGKAASCNAMHGIQSTRRNKHGDAFKMIKDAGADRAHNYQPQRVMSRAVDSKTNS
jgi:hypothetical protein